MTPKYKTAKNLIKIKYQSKQRLLRKMGNKNVNNKSAWK